MAQRESLWQRATAIADTVRSGSICPAHRMRQRDEPASVAVSGQTKGDGDPRSGWGGTAAASATIADRESAAVGGWRRRRAACGEVGRPIAGGDEPGRDRANQ